jgi:hypothetical protein
MQWLEEAKEPLIISVIRDALCTSKCNSLPGRGLNLQLVGASMAKWMLSRHLRIGRGEYLAYFLPFWDFVPAASTTLPASSNLEI